MNPAIVVVIILIVSAFLIWACKTKKLDSYFNFTSPLESFGYNSPPYPATIIVSPPTPAAYPMYDINYRYPFGVPWDVDINAIRRRRRRL